MGSLGFQSSLQRCLLLWKVGGECQWKTTIGFSIWYESKFSNERETEEGGGGGRRSEYLYNLFRTALKKREEEIWESEGRWTQWKWGQPVACPGRARVHHKTLIIFWSSHVPAVSTCVLGNFLNNFAILGWAPFNYRSHNLNCIN